MPRKSIYAVLGLTWLLLTGAHLMKAEGYRELFEFESTGAADEWQTVNDGVMGGVSEGRFRFSDENTMVFYGTLSLENNGGFTSVRSRPGNLGLEKGDKLVIRVKGDGRRYSLNLYTPGRMTAFSYRAAFATKKDAWTEVSIPIDEFVATSFGRVVKDQPLNPNEVNGIGILLGDRKAGPFKLEVAWIRIIKSD